jgi:hypothetical protein
MKMYGTSVLEEGYWLDSRLSHIVSREERRRRDLIACLDIMQNK